MLGLGAVGTYIGAHIAATGLPVTALVRPGKASPSRSASVTVTLPERSFTVTNVAIVEHVEAPFDFVVLACKAFQVPSAIEAVRPAIGERTIVLPFLNGMAHMATFDAAFSARAVGDIVALPGGRHLATKMLDEAVCVATAAGYPPTRDFMQQSKAPLTRAGSSTKASLLRDIEAGNRTEVDALMVDFTNTVRTYGVGCPLLDLATLHIRVHEARVAGAMDKNRA